MAHANCSVCNGEINTESSPLGKCVRCTEAEARQVALPLPLQEHVGPRGTVLMPAKPDAGGAADPQPESSLAPVHPHERGEHAHGKPGKHR